MSGINYPASLTKHVAEEAENSKIVKDQKADPKRNVLTGKHFGTENVKGNVNMDSLITIDEQKLARHLHLIKMPFRECKKRMVFLRFSVLPEVQSIFREC